MRRKFVSHRAYFSQLLTLSDNLCCIGDFKEIEFRSFPIVGGSVDILRFCGKWMDRLTSELFLKTPRKSYKYIDHSYAALCKEETLIRPSIRLPQFILLARGTLVA